MDEERMSCPRCGKEMRKGFLETSDDGRIFFNTSTHASIMIWYPEESKGKLFKKKGVIEFSNIAEAFYCDGCRGAFIDPFFRINRRDAENDSK